jgi:N-methylhydantoinase B/oxoprolinase/acetone carboxylase alpha subunit
MSPGSMPMAREIYQEGIRIPPILLERGGKLDRPLLRMILANVRTPEEREGDLRAQLMSNARGERRLREITTKYGAATVAYQHARAPRLQRAHDARGHSQTTRRSLPVRGLPRQRRRFP